MANMMEMMPSIEDMLGMMGDFGAGGGAVHPETGMTQAQADKILDDYAREHGIVIPYD